MWGCIHSAPHMAASLVKCRHFEPSVHQASERPADLAFCIRGDVGDSVSCSVSCAGLVG